MMPSRLAKKEKALHASTPQAPYVSIARGTQVQPSSVPQLLLKWRVDDRAVLGTLRNAALAMDLTPVVSPVPV